ncbi:MAG TPA: hypothetical protein VIZ43_30295 [Trebonia sp.]
MNRVIAVTAALATGTIAATAAIMPAMAAPRPVSAHSAARAKTTADGAKTAGRTAAAARPKKTGGRRATDPPTVIDSELDGGKYVTVVRCHGVDSPPPVTVGEPGTPLVVHGTDPAAAVVKGLTTAHPYKTIYACTVVVQQKVPPKPKPHKAGCEIPTSANRAGTCGKPVTLNTGFGGLAPQVKDHTPAG